MKLCMSMWSFQELVYGGQMDVRGFAEYCAKNKIRYAELLDFFVEEKLDAALQILTEYDIKPAVWSICNDFVQPDKQARLKQIDYVCKEIDIAARIGAPLMRIFSGDVKETVPFGEGLSSIKECLATCAAYAESMGVTLCLENHGVFAATGSQVYELLSQVSSPALRSNFDTANFLFVDQDPEEAAALLTGTVSLLHLKDYRLSDNDGEGWATEFKKIWYTGCPLGEGSVNLKRVIDALQRGGFDGVASIELESPEPIAAADQSLHFLREVVGMA